MHGIAHGGYWTYSTGKIVINLRTALENKGAGRGVFVVEF